MPFAAGQIVAKKYRLERSLGSGGMGEVWAAKQQPTDKLVALKFLKSTNENDKAAQKRFLREARAACAVRHPNVVEVYDVVELDDGAPMMVMEFLDGESLEQRLKRATTLPFGELTAILARVVSAVGAAHALGIVHRDLKPDNIFLSKTPAGTEVKVLDFGIAKVSTTEGGETAGLTNTGAMLGTPYYMAPEQAFGDKNIDHRADIWSLGIILYRGVTGVLPTQADNLGQILKLLMTDAIRPIEELSPRLPDDVKALVRRMLSIEPAGRPSDLREVRDLLERYAGVETQDFSAPSLSTSSEAIALSASASAPKKKSMVWLGVAAVAVLVSAGTWVVYRSPVASPLPSNEASGAHDASGLVTNVGSASLPESVASVASAAADSSRVIEPPVVSASASPKPTGAIPHASSTAAGHEPPTATSTPAASASTIFGVREQPGF